jgi:three-Cys-motif partner protein
MAEHRFGGDWTEEKLTRLRKYLEAYTTIFTRNLQAQYFRTTYVDAFAGTGSREERKAKGGTEAPLGLILDDDDARSFQAGSARIALAANPGFDQYLFIEANPSFAEELTKLQREFPGKTITVVSGDANLRIQEWCQRMDWSKNRAVVFLDPYGMEVEWSTIEAIASTQAIDVWILFPLGQAVNRLLTRKQPPPAAWAKRLTIFFGTQGWETEFYRPARQLSLLDGVEDVERSADLESISRFFLDRLGGVFAAVSQNPLPLWNSKGVPIYLLCFAVGNPRKADLALRIANNILRG